MVFYNNISCFQVDHLNFQKEIDDLYNSNTSYSRIVGSAINTACSVFNHSCLPNVSRIFLVGAKLVMYSMRPIKKGDQVKS